LFWFLPSPASVQKGIAMKILIVQETDWLIRNVIHQHHLGERLAVAGHEVRVIDYDILWQHKPEIPRRMPRQVFPEVNRVVEDVSLEVIRPASINFPLLCHATWAVNSLVELRRLYREWPFDIVIGLSLTNSYFMAQMLKRMKIPYVSMVLEPYHTMMDQTWAQFPARLVESMAMRQADRVIVFTPKMRSYAQQMGVDQDRVECLKTGVNLKVFNPDLDGSAQRASLGLSPEDHVIFFMGWLYEFAGLRQISDLLKQQPELLDNARLLVVGDGPMLSELRDLSEQDSLRGKIILTGKRPYEEIPQLLAAADVCLLPSLLNETTKDIVPMKVYEYLAAGKPVIVSDLPGLRTEFGFGNGILYGQDPEEVFKMALDLADDLQTARELGQNSRRYAEENADWDKTTRQLAAILFSTIKTPMPVQHPLGQEQYEQAVHTSN
jgi:glycosyltransferase involved in cell wall biosynthesis